MARWYRLTIAGQPIGPSFEAPDRRTAEQQSGALFGVMSVVEWEEVRQEEQALAKRAKARQEAGG